MATRPSSADLRPALSGERGALLLPLSGMIVAVLAGGMLLFWLGYATLSHANAQTASAVSVAPLTTPMKRCPTGRRSEQP